jgi:putative ABC transport system permease protein
MGVIWHKVWADLWSNKLRSLLVVLSVAVGVFSVGGVFGMADLLLRGMDRAHQAVRPSHINLILRGTANRQTIADLAQVPGVAGIDPVNQRSARFKAPGSDRWELCTVVMRDDYRHQSFDVLELKSGSWPDREHVGIERLSGERLGLSIGQEVILQIDRSERRFEIGGVVRHPFVKPPNFGGQVHFFVDARVFEEVGVAAGTYGQLLVRIDDYSYERARQVAGLLRSRLGELGIDVAVTILQEPERHWGRRFVEGVTVMLEIIALVSLLVSVMLVLTVMAAIINQQTSQIGVIKAVGGERRQIFMIFMANVVAFGLCALLLAGPLGALFAFAMTRWFLGIFNIDYETFELSRRALVLQSLASLLAPALAALPSVLKAMRITVREAIASYGLGGDFGSSWIDRAVERLGSKLLPTPYAAALGNLFRRKGRLVLGMAVFVIGGVLFLSVMSLVSSVRHTLDGDTERKRYDIRVGFTQPQAEREVLEVVSEVEGLQQPEIWYRRNALILLPAEQLAQSTGLSAQLLGLPAPSALFKPIIASGRWLGSSDRRALVMSAESAERNGLRPGDRVSIQVGSVSSAGWDIVGTYRTIVGPEFALEPLYAPIDEVRSEFGGSGQGTHVVLSTRHRGSRTAVDSLERQLQERFAARGIDVDLYSSSNVLKEREDADNQFRTVITLFFVLAVLVALVGGIGLMGSLGIAVNERTREIGVMRAIGASSHQITSIFVLEGVLQGVLSFALSVPIAYAAARPLASLLGQTMIRVDLDYTFNHGAVAVWLAMILVVSILASIWPAVRATRLSVRESLAFQ